MSIETNETAETATTVETGASRDELMAAYRTAVGGEDSPKPDGGEPKLDSVEPKPDGGESAPDAKGIAKVLKQREKANAAREEAKKAGDEARTALAEAKAVREAAAAAKKEAEAFLDLLRRNPIEAIKKAGWDPDDLVLNLRDSGTPGSAAQREQLALRQEMAELKASLRERDAQAERRAAEAQRQEAERGFLAIALDAEKFPALSHVYGKRQHLLIAEATRIAEAYHQRTGQYATWGELAEYIDSEHADLRATAPAAATAPTTTKTITAGAASERASTPVLEWDQMSENQRRDAQIADMRAAIRKVR